MAHPLWEPDGTQPPPRAWPDPVTGGKYEQERFTIDVVAPVMPDLDEVRRQVDAVLSAEEEQAQPLIPAPRRQSEAARDMPGMVASNPRPGWPRSPSVRQLPGLRPKSGPPPRVRKVRNQRRQQGSSMGIGAVIAMVVVFIGIIVVALASLVNMINDLFR